MCARAPPFANGSNTCRNTNIVIVLAEEEVIVEAEEGVVLRTWVNLGSNLLSLLLLLLLLLFLLLLLLFLLLR